MMTKKLFFTILVLTIAFSLQPSAWSLAFATTPKIKIVTEDADLGEVEKNKIFDFKIEVKNMGKEDLVITNVSSSCGCLELTDERWTNTQNNAVAAELALPNGDSGKASFAATPAQGSQGKASFAATPAQGSQGKASFAATPVVIKPNHSVYISARVDTNKVSGDFEKMIHVFSNDAENKDVMWKVRGRVALQEPSLQPSPLPSPLKREREQSVERGWSELREQGVSNPPLPFMGDAKQNPPLPFMGEGRGEGENSKLILFFHTPGCRECEEVRDKFFPELKEKYGDKILIVDYNIDNMESYAFFLELQEKYDERAKKGFFNPKPPALFAGNRLLYGVKEIEEGLEELIR